jgi:hypothetical protein
MHENKFLSVVAGAIIGVILGTTYYLAPAKCLITGPMTIDGIFIPQDLNSAIVLLSLKWGGTIGGIIGLFGGLAVPVTMPRGHMAKSISCTLFIVCVPIAFIMHGSQLFLMPGWKILVTFLWVFGMFLLAIPFGAALGFIEKIRE